jgi:hypothetical protein
VKSTSIGSLMSIMYPLFALLGVAGVVILLAKRS